MLGLVLPNSKSVLLKKYTFENCKELHGIQNNKEAVISYFNNLFITPNLNIIEKFYCLLHLRDLCIGNIIELRDFNFDIILLQDEIQEIEDIKRVITFEDSTITLNFPKNFSYTTLHEDSFIESITLDGETIDYSELNIENQNLIFNYIPATVKTEINNFYKQHIKKLKIEFLIKGKVVSIDFTNEHIIDFLTGILIPIDEKIYRDYIFILSERIKDVGFLQQSTYLDIKDYMDLYIRESEDRQEKLKNKNQ